MSERIEIPPGLKKRWEEFGNLSKRCWSEVKGKKLPTEKEFPEFWDCMKGFDDPVTPAEQKECAEIGHPLAPHPICVIAQTVHGASPAEAVEKCLQEGRVHGISLIACRAAKTEI